MTAARSVLVHDIRSVFAILAPQILNDWKFVLRRLGITDHEIQEIVALNRNRKPAEVVYRGLIRWENNSYGKPSMDTLVNALIELKLNDAADVVRKYRIIGPQGPPSAGYAYTRDKRPQRVALSPKERLRTEREMSDDLVVEHIVHPMARQRYPGAYNLATHQERVMVHPLATYRDPPLVHNMSFDNAQTSPFYHDDRRKRHSWSTDLAPSLLESRLKYSYVSQIISPSRKFEREPWFVSVDFLKNGDVVLLDKENKQVEVHQCRILPSCRRYVFSHSFRVCKDFVGSEPSDIAVFDNYIIVIDRGQRCMRIFTADGKSTGSVKFRNQPRCLAVNGSTFAIAFWDLTQGKGSIVLYRAGIEKVTGRGKKLTLINPKHVESATECYDTVGLNHLGDVIALSQDGRLFLHSLKSPFQDKYVCRNEATLPRVRSMVVKGNIVVLCNTYQDSIAAVGLTTTTPRTFDLSNMNEIMSDDDGLYAPRAMAFYNDDLVLVHRYGADVRVFGTVTWSKQPRNGFVTFRL